ncbi:MAG: hypothetical protein EZS28_011607 [Streblomastix strix]|uniref:Uncharacterized protein n=1 Tax=Streblomastix strix TaxID=222440 RepID=A0A5J4WDW6_9EUKA|nr:MAG: hypothetical protein EZS28_011607 [Streblomastix strix]
MHEAAAQMHQSDSFVLANKINQLSAQMCRINRQFQAGVSELAIFQARSRKLQADQDELENEQQNARLIFEQAAPPTEDTVRKWNTLVRMKQIDEERLLQLMQEPPIGEVRTNVALCYISYVPEDGLGTNESDQCIYAAASCIASVPCVTSSIIISRSSFRSHYKKRIQQNFYEFRYEVYGPDPFEKWRKMAQVGPEGIQIQQGGEMNVQHGGVPQPTPGDESGAQQLQNARQTGKEWLQPFTNKGMSPEEEARRKEMLALGKAVLEGYYHVSLDKLDQTGERAYEETRLEIRRREQMIRTLIHEDKAVKALAGDKDSQIERETQIFAIHAQEMIEAAIVSLIGDDNVSAMNSLLSAHHACRIVAGDAQKRREVAVVPSSAKEALLTGGGLTLLLGSESKAIVAEALKSSKLISSQQTTNIQQIADDKTQQVQQQQVPFMNTFQQNQRQFNNRKFGRRFPNFGASNSQFVPFNSQNNYGQWGNQWQQLPGWSQQANGWGTIQAGYNPNVSQMNQYQQQQQDNRSWQPGQKRGLNMAPTQLPKPPLENHVESDHQKNQ